MIGSSASTFSGLRQPLCCRARLAARSACPARVVPAAVSRARNSVFQATPQRTPPARQPRPQTRSCAEALGQRGERRRAGFVEEGADQALAHRQRDEQQQQRAAAAPRRRRRTGRRGSSPAARCPAPSSISSDSSASAPPRPMPNCPAGRAPNQRVQQLEGPAASRRWRSPPPAGPARPTAAPASSSAPWRRPAGQRHADSRQQQPGQRRSTARACQCAAPAPAPLAVSAPPNTPGSDCSSVRFCGKYQGSSTKAASAQQPAQPSERTHAPAARRPRAQRLQSARPRSSRQRVDVLLPLARSGAGARRWRRTSRSRSR